MKDNQSIGAIGHPPHGTHEYAEYLSQSERLALYASRRYDEEISTAETKPVKLSRKQRRMRAVCGLSTFRMPAIKAVSEEEWLNQHYEGGATRHALDAEEDEEQDEEGETRKHALNERMDSMREHSFLMPSQRGYGAAYAEAKSYGYAND